jgi:HPt (histidine-containing phosphotransfer) domain-containing protein
MPITDLSFLREFCRNDKEKMAEYIRIFLESIPETLNELEQRLNENDIVGLKKSIHAIKPQVTFLGLESLKEQIEQMEEAIGITSSTSEVTRMVNQFKSTLELSAEQLVETLISLS